MEIIEPLQDLEHVLLDIGRPKHGDAAISNDVFEVRVHEFIDKADIRP